MAETASTDLRLHSGALVRSAEVAARDTLIAEVLGTHPTCGWRAFAVFDGDGRCVANVDAAILPGVVEGRPVMIGALAAAAVHPEWRGRGLFRSVMEEALAWCEPQAPAILLFTGTPDLYRRFGFRQVAQHAFLGAPPPEAIGYGAQPLDPIRDQARIRALVRRRTAPSRRFSLFVDAPVFLGNLARDRDLEVAHLPELEAMVLYQMSDDVLTIADLVATRMPRLSDVLGALNLQPRLITTLFTPDLLDWHAEPRLDDTGLMIRGGANVLPNTAFMIPPTMEF